MTPNDSVSVALILSIASLVCTIINTFGGGRKRQKDEMEAEIKRQSNLKSEFVKVNFKLDEFCRRLDEVVRKYDETNLKLDDHEKRISVLETKVK